mmetsp:Transcript_7054/g.10705  ORF Transcript_7054/g.10705 Transcript_7054/m.10705 type:complete len:81 (+) Transcript_7054:172-414(+)
MPIGKEPLESTVPSLSPSSINLTNIIFPTAAPSPCPSTKVEGMKWEPKKCYPGKGRNHPITFANETHGFLLTGFEAAAST